METTWDGLPVADENPRVSSVVVWRSGAAGREYLLLHRHHHGPEYSGDWAWTPPSGARRPGEAPEEAAARELREEAGLELPVEPVHHAIGEVALFCAEAPADAEIVLDPEHDRFEWVTAEEARRRCLPPVVGESVAIVDGRVRAAETP